VLQAAAVALATRLPRKAPAIATACRLISRGVTTVTDGVQFADGATVRRPAGTCDRPGCQQATSCVHELAFLVLQEAPVLIAPQPSPLPPSDRPVAPTPDRTRALAFLRTHRRQWLERQDQTAHSR
jgi:hypothetical protein